MRRWVICVAALMMSGCSMLFPNQYKFRLTVEVETPEGLRRGSGVYEVRAYNIPALLPDEAKRDWEVRGDAVAVDLPGGKTLFALLKTSNLMRKDLAQMSMAALDPAFKNDIVDSAGRLSRRSGVRTNSDIASDDYPLLVTFRDTADSTTVVQVEPDDLDPHFGAGVRLRRIWVELTDDDVTRGIQHRLGWLGNGGRGLDPNANPTTNPTFALTLQHSAFWQGAHR